MKPRTILALTVVLLVVFPWKPALSRGPRKALFSIEASVAQDVVPSGSPVKLKAEVTNNSAREIEVWVGSLAYAIQLRDNAGNLMQTTEKYRQEQRKPHLRLVATRVGPGETQKFVFDLSEMYDLSKLGEYSAQIRWDGHQTYSDVPSNTVRFSVTSAIAQRVETPTTSFTLEIDALQDVVRLGSKITVDIFATNVTAHELALDNSWNMYSIEVRDQSQMEPAMTEAGKELRRHYGEGLTSPVRLNPGQLQGLGAVDISDLYDFRKPGEYSIQIARMDEETKTFVKSNTINLTVKLRSKRK
jgi:hypothetical protein